MRGKYRTNLLLLYKGISGLHFLLSLTVWVNLVRQRVEGNYCPSYIMVHAKVRDDSWFQATDKAAVGRSNLKIKVKFVSSQIQTRSRQNETSVTEVTPKTNSGSLRYSVYRIWTVGKCRLLYEVLYNVKVRHPYRC